MSSAHQNEVTFQRGRQHPSQKFDMSRSLYVSDLITPAPDSILRQSTKDVVQPEAKEYESGEKLRESAHRHVRYVHSPPKKYSETVISSQEVGWRSSEGSSSVAQYHRHGSQITHYQEAMITMTKGGDSFLRK